MLNKRSQYLATGTAATCDVMRCCLTVSSQQRSVGRACIRPRCLIALSKLFLVRTLLRLGKPAFFMSTPPSWRASLMAVVTDVWLLAFLHASISSAVRSESLRSAHGVSQPDIRTTWHMEYISLSTTPTPATRFSSTSEPTMSAS